MYLLPMKMNYRQKSKTNFASYKSFMIVVAIGLLLALSAFLFPSVARRFSYGLAKPVWYVGTVVSKPFVGIKGYFTSKSTLISKNLELEDLVASLRLKEIDYEVLSKENLDLRSELNRTERPDRIISRVLSKPPRSPYDTFVIDAGSTLGVTLGSKVYLSDNIVIGTVTNVTPRTSLVKLFSSSGEKQESVLSRTGASFTLVGRGGANLTLEVPKDADVLWGDSFMYPGFDPSIIGTAYYIDTDTQSSFKTVYIRISGNVFQAKSVFVENPER